MKIPTSLIDSYWRETDDIVLWELRDRARERYFACRNCGDDISEHPADGKCLFDSGYYEPKGKEGLRLT